MNDGKKVGMFKAKHSYSAIEKTYAYRFFPPLDISIKFKEQLQKFKEFHKLSFNSSAPETSH
jgi:hypothetical protein